MNLRDRLKRLFQRRPEGTPGQLDQERETAVSLGLMAGAAAAGPEMSDDQRIFLSQSAAGMRARTDVLLRIPNRSLAQERELQMIDRELARIEGRSPSQPVPVRIVRRDGGWQPPRFLGPLAASPVLAILANPFTWIAVGVAAFAVQTARLNNAKGDLREARADLAMSERNLADARAINQRLAEDIRAADELSRQTAANLEAERRRSAALRQRQRERAREATEILTRNQPPSWDDRLRDLGPEAGAGSDSTAASDTPGLPR